MVDELQAEYRNHSPVLVKPPDRGWHTEQLTAQRAQQQQKRALFRPRRDQAGRAPSTPALNTASGIPRRKQF